MSLKRETLRRSGSSGAAADEDTADGYGNTPYNKYHLPPREEFSHPNLFKFLACVFFGWVLLIAVYALTGASGPSGTGGGWSVESTLTTTADGREVVIRGAAVPHNVSSPASTTNASRESDGEDTSSDYPWLDDEDDSGTFANAPPRASTPADRRERMDAVTSTVENGKTPIRGEGE
jgi:hypothetical protein